MRRALLIFLSTAALLAFACNKDFAPASEVTGLRILGVRAEPAEVAPGQPVTFEALVVNPSRPDAGSAMVWIGCAPTPENTTSPCANTDALLVLRGGRDGGGIPPGMRVLGAGPRVRTVVPTDVFSPDAGELERQRGVLGSVLVIAADAPQPTNQAEADALIDRITRGEVPSQAALFRYPISESASPNHNPVLQAFVVDGQRVPPNATVRIPEPDASIDLEVPDASFEPYVEQTPSGPVDQVERLAARYYATPGIAIDTLAVEVHGTVIERIGPNDGGIAGAGGITDGGVVPEHLWSVVIDTRGGQSWIDAPAFVCDRSLPAPVASGTSVDGGTLLVTGQNLGSVLDLQLGDAVALGTRCDPQSCTGVVPVLDAGTYPLVLRAKTCADVDTGLTVPLP